MTYVLSLPLHRPCCVSGDAIPRFRPILWEIHLKSENKNCKMETACAEPADVDVSNAAISSSCVFEYPAKLM